MNLKNKRNINGSVLLFTKKRGNQNHKIEINFEKGKVILFTNSKDWTKNFTLKIFKNNKYTIVKNKTNKDFKDGRSIQIYKMLKNRESLQFAFENLGKLLSSNFGIRVIFVFCDVMVHRK